VTKTVAIEEHFWIPKLQTEETVGVDIKTKPRWVQGLGDLGEQRLKEMDEAGIDLQVIAHAPPAAQNFPPDQAVALAREANDTLYRAICAHPHRFAGFATLPTPDPEAAAAELERAVTKLGFKGAMIYGLTHGAFTDEKRFWCIYERAAALDVPIYIHPGPPHRAVVDAYFKGYPTMDGAGLGFTFETAAHAIRLSIRRVSQAASYPRPYGRRAALPALALRHGAIARQGPQAEIPRLLPRAFLHHDERQFLASGAALHGDGDEHRSHHLRRRLALRFEQRGARLHRQRAAIAAR
jgi:hypothetical protein